jgi:hypothetical protein
MNGRYGVGNDGYANTGYNAMPMQKMSPAVEMSAHMSRPSEMQGEQWSSVPHELDGRQ